MTKQGLKDVVRPHVVDGIEEYDNPLPPWWVWLFVLTIAFGIAYLIYFHILGRSDLERELVQERKVRTEQAAAKGPGDQDDAALAAIMQDPKRREEGKVIFENNCAPCHGNLGQGVIGPNLTDEYWIHGGDAKSIIATIKHGVPAKGMLAWEPVIGSDKILSVSSYIISLAGTHPPQAKAAEGDLVVPPPAVGR